MDFKRIEIIFLCVFVALDIFLFFSYNQSRNAVVMTNNSSPTTLAKEMSQDNIVLDQTPSDRPSQGYYLASKDSNILQNHPDLKNQAVTYDGNKRQLHSVLDVPWTVNRTAPQKTLNRLKNKDQNILYGNQYQYAPHLSDQHNLVYVQKQGSGQFYSREGQLIFQIVGRKVVGYQQTYINGVTFLREKQNTISERRAIEILYTNNEIPSGARIRWIDLAYKRLLRVRESTVYIPVWYVGFVNKNSKVPEIRRINAFNGTIIKDTSN
ncbi:two-component system regulatory protein YycI [Lactobacillus sp. DCY120]|uniref:Two-component system regulatory protein YycI n=1 Tax=Bombilactobacillus apium TaxID=2675299 RepID=A0A850R0G2_9LACO|nr:two-component system regulatory protein YycI [Bombilactobacillus apium]NVY96549.1 two-component system regulatory protein YycI [Bombilactobacillus apium]